LHSRSVIIRAAASDYGGGNSRSGTGSRRVYRESQAPSPVAASQEIGSFLLSAGALAVVTFVIWKLVEKILVPKPPAKPAAEISDAGRDVKWSFAPGTNLSSRFGEKVERESRLRLNDFAKELKTFVSVDMSGRNFGDEGLFFLAGNLAYNQIVEEVNFAANGITADGIKAFDGILQSNIVLKTLDLSGNSIGDEGLKYLCSFLSENSGIQKLQLNSCAFGDEGAKAVAEMLKKNSTLRFVELNNNLIDYSGFSSLAGALLENRSILSLYLNGNYGGPLGAAGLAKGLEGNKSLRELFLQGNSIGDEGVAALMSGLSSHKGKLTTLDLSNNSISSRGASHVAEYVKKSKTLLWINLYMNDIGDE
ncbi:chloroplast envelope protein 1, partial [Genlisea aurea]